MSQDRSLIIALASRVGHSNSSHPLNSQELSKLISSGDFEVILGSGEVPESETTASIGIDRIRHLLRDRNQVAFEIEALEHKGIWCLTLVDGIADSRLPQSLGDKCPAMLFGVGDKSLIGEPSYGVVGSRNLGENGLVTATSAGAYCASQSHVLVSGGARGADLAGLTGCIENGGRSVIYLASGISTALRDPYLLSHVHEGNLTVMSPYMPNTAFSVGNAMGRNKLIYGASKSVLVVACDAGKGGTWNGATEALRHRYSTVNVWVGTDEEVGNKQLIQEGANPVTSIESAFLQFAPAEKPSFEQGELF